MTDKVRAEFEAWATDFELYKTPDGEDYALHETDVAWQAWQASRAALVLDVSGMPSASYTDSDVVYRSHIEDALDAAGVAYK